MTRYREDLPTKGTGVTRYVVAGIVAAIVLVVLAAVNSERTAVDLVVWDGQAPLYAVVLISAIVGAIVVELFGAVWRHRRHRHNEEKRELVDLRDGHVGDILASERANGRPDDDPFQHESRASAEERARH